MFYSDKPISNEYDDELNRMAFVKKLSKSICNYNSSNCMVIGLMGGWGCGKTSILNLTFNEIKNERKDWVLIDFDPWYFSNQDNLILQFFNRLLSELQSDKITKNAKDLLFKFMKGLSISANLKVLSANLNLSEVLKQEEFEKFNSFKQDLVDIFSNLDYKIVISIDNIDRLTADEIKQIFFLVKSLADFPNVLYILSFDKNYVKNLLDDDFRDFDEFIKKIIQIPINIPLITESKMDSLIYELISSIYNDNVNVGNKFLNNGFWEFSTLLKPFFMNIRDLKRYVNVVNFYWGIFEDITFVDFMLIQALEMFEHDVFLKIKENKGILTGEMSHADNSDKFNSSVRELYDQLLKEFKNSNPANRDLLKYLFPVFSEVDGENAYSVRRVNYRDDKFRICSEDYFDKYFTLSLEESEISEDFIKRVLSLSNEDEISDVFLKLKDENKLKYLFDKLLTNIKKIKSSNYIYFIASLLKVGDELLDDELINDNHQVYILLNALFTRIESSRVSFHLLKNALNQDKNLFTPIEYVYSIGYDLGKYDSGVDEKSIENYSFKQRHFEQLEKIAYDKIKELEKSDELQNYSQLKVLLIYWEKFGNKNEVQDFVNRITKEDDDLIRFLDKFKIIIHVNDKSIKRFDFDFEELRKYFNFNLLINRLSNIVKLKNHNQEFCEYFLLRASHELYQRRTS